MAQTSLLENIDEGKAPVFSSAVTLHDGRPATTSLAIAEHFGKRHDHVLRSINDLLANCPEEFAAPNFGASEYTDETGRKLPMFTVFFDGFILLVMGYTGKKALQVKLMYISAFNAMKEKLDNLAAEERARLAGDVKALPADSFPEASITLTKSTVDDRQPIRQIVDTWAELAEKPHFLLYRQLRAAFQLKNIKELPAEWVPDAVAWVQERIDSLQKTLPPATPATPPSALAAPAAPAVAQPILSAELDRCMAEFEVLARSVEDMERLMVRVRRLASPITSAAARAMAGSGTTDRTSLEGLLEEYLDRSRRLAMELVPCARLGINVMRDLAQAQGR